MIWALSFDIPNISEGYIVRYTHNITFQNVEMYSKKIITRYIASILVFATVKKPKVYILRRLQNTIKKAAGDYSELIGALWTCCNMVVAVYLLIRTYQQLYALISSGFFSPFISLFFLLFFKFTYEKRKSHFLDFWISDSVGCRVAQVKFRNVDVSAR